MNNPNFRNNDDMKKQNRIVYTVLSLSLAVLAILISISVISQRNKAEPSPEKKPETTVKAPDTTERKPETTEKKDETTAAPESSDTADAGVDAAADVLPDFIAPVPGAVIKGYSTSVPVYSQTMDDYRVHSGVDLAASIGDNVYAAATGTVGAVWEDPMNGCSLHADPQGRRGEHLLESLKGDSRDGEAGNVDPRRGCDRHGRRHVAYRNCGRSAPAL